MKKFIIFQETERSSLKFKKLLIFQERELSYIFSKKIFFVIFWKMEPSIFKEVKKKKKKTVILKIFSPSLKNPLLFRERTYKAWKSKISSIFFRIFCLLKAQRKKVSCTFLYKEGRFSKLKYFLVIMIKHFFSFYDVFSILRNLLSIIFWWIYDHSRPYCCFFFLIRKILISITSFFSC